MTRSDFDKILQGLVIPEGTPVETINEMVKPIRDAIAEMLPASLYRFRPCGEKQIDAFEKDRIFAVPADWFNDPYDTLVRYDLEEIKNYAKSFSSIKNLERLKDFFAKGNDFPKEFKQVLPDEAWDSLRKRILEISNFKDYEKRIEQSSLQLLSLVSTYFPIISFYGKRFSNIACFSEDVRSILMWSHYADSHKGFALEYDFRTSLNKSNTRAALYPVIYSEDRYDASLFLAWAFFTMMGFKAVNPDIVSSTKAALYKSTFWEYEKEWRMIDPGPHDILNPKPSIIEYRPVAIYYGHNISLDNKARLHEIAKEKGIKEYEMYIDRGSQKYEMQYRSFVSETIPPVSKKQASALSVINQ